MGNIKNRNLLSAYLANVPFWVGAASNLAAGAICRHMSAVFPSQSVCLCAAAMMFAAAALNFTVYMMCSAFCHKEPRKLPRAAAAAGIAAAFIIGALLAPFLYG